jgi:transposase
VVAKAVAAVYQDGMALRCVASRLARDFWVLPSEESIRQWCQQYSASFDFESEYQPWVVQTFSGVLCVDEVYQGKLALLLAVDPAGANGDRLVGYQVVTGAVEASEVEAFLVRLQAVGIDPSEVITDGSALYPAVLQKVWPTAAHQLCLFHETRRVTAGVMKLVNAVRKSLPPLPSPSAQRGARPLRRQPPSADHTAPTRQRWEQRQAERQGQVTQVQQLAEQGLSQRAIARQTGYHRRTVKTWLQPSRPPSPPAPSEPPPRPRLSAVQPPGVVKQQKKRRAHELAGQGWSNTAIAHEVGVHRVTIQKWLQQELPLDDEPLPSPAPLPEPPSPPTPWHSWEQVREVREALQNYRFLLLRHPAHLNSEEQAQLASLLKSPVGADLQLARAFLVDWYWIWQDEQGEQRSLAAAQQHYEAWHSAASYAEIPVLHQVQQRFPQAKFAALSQFLRQPTWEATNNGAERTARWFRHRQAPHFNLRVKDTLAASLTVAACLQQQALTAATRPLHTCQRGRKPGAKLALSSLRTEWAVAHDLALST